MTDGGHETESKISVALSKEEAIVLFEFLSRFSDKETLNIQHQAEERVLWNLASMFEENLSEPLSENHQEILNAARDGIKDQNE